MCISASGNETDRADLGNLSLKNDMQKAKTFLINNNLFFIKNKKLLKLCIVYLDLSGF